MNKELTLEHLSGYLPYGLKAEMLDYKSDYVGRQYDVIIGVHQWSKNGDWCLLTDGGSKPSFNHIKPILRPLTDLTKEIEVNGEMFVPMKWFEKNTNKSISFYKPLNEDFNLQIDIETENYSQTIDLFDGYLAVQKLLSWHFDIFGLIEQNLAIDINTLNK